MLVAFVVLLVGLGGLWTYWDWKAGGFRPEPKLVQGLSFGSDQIGARLRKRYPIGSDAKKLQYDLEHDAFQVMAPGGSANAQWGDGVPCQYSAEVNWRTDAKGRLTLVDGDYENACW